MWLKRLSLLVFLIPGYLFSQSEIALSVNELIESGEYQEAINRADSLLESNTISNDDHYLYSKKGDAFYYLGDIKKALENYLSAITEPEIMRLENQAALQEALSYAGFCYGDLGIHDKAIEMYKKSQELAIALNDSVEVAVSYFNIATSLIKQGNLEQGLTELGKAYKIDLLRKDTSAIGFDLNALGYAALEMNNTDQAIQYFKESISILNQSEGNYNSLGTRYNNLSKAFTRAEVWDSALYYNKASIEIHEKYNDKINLAERWINRAMILNEMNLYRQAIEWGLKAKSEVIGLRKSDLILKVNHVLIDSYRNMGKLSDALNIAESNIELAKETPSVGQLIIVHRDYAELLYETGRSKEAYEISQTANYLKDSLKSIEVSKAITELSVKYEVDKILSEKEILELQNDVALSELRTRKLTNWWLTALVFIVLIAGIGITYSLVTKSRMKEQLLQTEVNELRLQIKQLIDYQPENSILSIDKLNQVLNEPLSDREFEVLQMAMTDKNNSEIAEKIFISTNTVKYHLKNIYNKLGVSNRKEALKFAFQATSG